MRLLYASPTGVFPTNFEMPSQGFWLYPDNSISDEHDCPTKVYNLAESAKLYHIRKVSDYIMATMAHTTVNTYNYDADNSNIDKCIAAIAFIAKLKLTTEQDSGLSAEVINQIAPSNNCTPYLFYDQYNNLITKSGKPLIEIVAVKKGNNFSYKAAIAQCKFKMVQLIAVLKTCSYTLHNYNDPKNLGIIVDINISKMRDSGYDGFYVHKSAISEAKELYNGANSLAFYNNVMDFRTESVCIWNWCFAE